MDGGGGKSIAAQVARATDAFIKIVEENPEIFPEVDPDVLRAGDTDFIIVKEAIKICKLPGTLDAYTYQDGVSTLVNELNWINLEWLDQVHLAAHERLVLTKYEKSNRYNISNRLYEVDLKKRIAKLGLPKNTCDFGTIACEHVATVDRAIVEIYTLFNNGDLTREGVIELVGSWRSINGMTIDSLVSIFDLWKSKKDAKVKKYRGELELAFDNHFNPIFGALVDYVNQGTPEEIPCVKL